MIHTDGKPTIACRVVPVPVEIPVMVVAASAPPIAEDSWLQDEDYAEFRRAYVYASTQTYAIEALSHITPEMAYHLFEALKRGEEAVR